MTKSQYQKEQEKFEARMKRNAAESEKLHQKIMEDIKKGKQETLDGE